MTSGTERRLKRLERRAEAAVSSPEERLARARAAIEDGSATLAQYLLVYRDDIDACQRELVAFSPLVALGLERGLWITGPVRAVGYPPGCTLDGTTAEEVVDFRYVGTSTADERENLRRGGMHDYWLRPEFRARHAIWYLALGGTDDALSVRRRAWSIEGDHWVHSAAAVEESQALGTIIGPLVALHSGLQWADRDTCPKAIAKVTAQVKAAGMENVTYASLAEWISSAELKGRRRPPEWSKEVKAGHTSIEGILPDPPLISSVRPIGTR